jgi:predicted RNA-binding Zn ribbon-like protein
VAGNLALELANTVDVHGEGQGCDYLFPGYGNLVAWARHIGLVDDDIAQTLLHLARENAREAVAVRRRAVALRDAMIDVFTRHDTPADALATIEAEWRLAEPRRRLAARADGGATWTWPDEISLESPLWPIVHDAVVLLTTGPVDRVRQCASATCDWLFIDTTKNGSRRFCSASGCGTRTRVARHRAAHR